MSMHDLFNYFPITHTHQCVVAISQRNHTTYYPHLQTQENTLSNKIQECFEDHIKNEFKLSNYIFDCYISEKNNKVWIIDFNMFSQHTDPLLFTWDELMCVINNRDNDDVIMRVVTEEKRITMDPLSSYRAPVDTVDLACLENGIDFEEFCKLCERPSAST